MNKLIVAAAGSGKTTYLVKKALSIKEETILITTYTEANKDAIKEKIIKEIGYIPKNITILTWFTFLLKDGVRPYQDFMDDNLHNKSIGFYLSTMKSGHRYGNVYWGEKDFYHFYFTDSMKIYSDKISNFILKCNKNSKNLVFDRINRIYSNIFIDEVQDLVGYDLDIIKEFIGISCNILLVGDPRQVTYLTHPTTKHKKYSQGKIIEFIKNEVNKKEELCQIDERTLNDSHRNNSKVTSYSSKLYKNLPIVNSCKCCKILDEEHKGIFLIRKSEITEYLNKYNPVQLRWSRSIKVNNEYKSFNFGEAKGLTFDRVLLYPTKDMIEWIKDNTFSLKDETRAKFYVGLTRSRISTTIVYDYPRACNIDGLEKYYAGV